MLFALVLWIVVLCYYVVLCLCHVIAFVETCYCLIYRTPFL